MSGFIVRRLSPVARQRMAETPVLLLEGPRSVGKSTLLAEVASAVGASIFDLDEREYLRLVQASPTAVTGEGLPVLIDEYQKAPELLDAIKARLNKETHPGMFVLAGSASYDSLPTGTQALTGRIQRLPVMPLTQTEIDGTDNRFIEHAFAGEIRHTPLPGTADRLEYVRRVMRGGMPLALAAPSPAARDRWVQGHIRQSLEKDAGELRRISRKADLPQVLTRTAAQTAGLLNLSKIAQGLEASRTTISSYVALLESLFLISTLPAWGTTVSSRSIAAPKIHVVDSGMGAILLRLSASKLERRDPSALTEFGHLLESFVVQEVLRQVTWLDDVVTAGHWRTRDSDEVDLVLERSDGAMVAIEVKAGDHVDGKQIDPMRKLRDRLGAAFIAGVAFHLGRIGYEMDDRIHSLPVERLWV